MIFDKLTNLQLIFCYSLQLIFCQYCRLIFSDIFWKNIFTWYFCNLFFCYSLQLILGQSFRIIFLANHVNLFFWYFLQQFFPLIFLQFFLPFFAIYSSVFSPFNPDMFKFAINGNFLETNWNFTSFHSHLNISILFRIILSTPCKAQLNLQNLTEPWGKFTDPFDLVLLCPFAMCFHWF